MQNSQFSRRTFLSQTMATIGAAGSLVSCKDVEASGPQARIDTSLKSLASQKNMYYGAAIRHSHLLSDKAFQGALVAECNVLVPENELKWLPLQPKRGRIDYSNASSMVNFAIENQLRVRGHTAAWYKNPPLWVQDAISSNRKNISLLFDHVHEVVSHFDGQIFEWDVVNEAVEPKHGLRSGLRNSIFYQAGGNDYIAKCFESARSASPNARLYYNDYGLEYQTDYEEERRQSVLMLLTNLKRAGTPVDALGIQSHLKVGNRFNERIFANFLAEVANLGLKIVITELDVDDVRLNGDMQQRDAKVAEHTQMFLDVAFDQPAVVGLVTWGLSDRYSWLNEERPREDHEPHRSLPLDQLMERKPMWEAIAGCFLKTPKRAI